MPGDEARVHREVLDAHRDVVAGVLSGADDVAAGWNETVDGHPATADRDAVVAPLEAALDARGLPAALAAVLETAVDAAGASLQAPPVPAPPYVVVTATGPVLRATLPDRRLVLAIECFRVDRGGRTRYVRVHDDPAAAVAVAFR